MVKARFNVKQPGGPPPSSSTGQSGPGRIGGKGALEQDAGVNPVTDLQGINPPPAYDDIFTKHQPSPPPTIPTQAFVDPDPAFRGTQRQTNYYRDDRNLWEKLHEWFELSALQQLIWLAVLAFSISYITFGSLYSGQCIREKLDSRGKVVEQDDLTALIKAEGGVVCATTLLVLLLRLLTCVHRRRSHRITNVDLQARKTFNGQMFFLRVVLYVVNFALCVAGATKILPLYEDVSPNNTVTCNPVFHTFYYHAKIAQLAVFMPYAAYVFFGLFCVLPLEKRWFVRRKLRQWAKLLDADQDGVISQADMKTTNVKLEEIRQLFGARTNALSPDNQKKWWNEHIFKRGAGKDISVDEYISYMEGLMCSLAPHERANKVKPIIHQWFGFFSTAESRKTNAILGEVDFCKFWTILAGVDKSHSRRIFIRNIPTPYTMNDFLDGFITLLSHDEFFDETSNRIFNVVKFQPKGICCKA